MSEAQKARRLREGGANGRFVANPDLPAKGSEAYRKHRSRIVRRSILLTKYGKTIEEIEGMFAGHDGLCDICNQEGGKKGLHLDHCHETGRIRGLLCIRCNLGLGHFNDDPERLVKALAYLGVEL